MPRIILFDNAGQRKYLTPQEREQFYTATSEVSKEWRLFGLMLYYTGCRLSEALNLQVKDIDYSAGATTFNTLKQRRDDIYRQVPLPDAFLTALDDAYDLKRLQKQKGMQESYLWGKPTPTTKHKKNPMRSRWGRRNGYQVIKEIMALAGLSGIPASPKGLRHGFAIACLDKGVPLNMVSKWLGHSSIETTAIYINAIGQEERKLAAKLWE